MNTRPIRTLVLAALLTGSAGFAFDHDYSGYSAALSRYVANGEVDYAGLAVDRAALDSLLAASAQVSFEEYKTFSRARQICFMVNLYNAAALTLILDHYPVASVREIGGLFSGPWNTRFISLFDRKVSLGQIQHDILRSEFKEPRLHFAISGAARGAPHLRGEPYHPDRLEQQLSEAERCFLTARPDLNRLEDGTLYLSPLFQWFAEDFDGTAGVLKLAQRYFPQAAPDTKIVYSEYDWSLNSRP